MSADKVTKQGIADSYFYLIGKMQMVADVPTWLGAYEKAMADPTNVLDDGTVDEARAVALADQAVIDSQGSGHIKDMASVQRGPAYLKLWTNFYSFFNVTYNQWMESQRKARTQRTPAAMGRLAVDYLLLFVVPATLGALLRDLLRGEDDEEVLVRNVITANLSYMLGTMLFMRELGGAVQGYAGYEGPAGARPVARLVTFTRALVQGDATTPAALRALWDAAGAVFHFPAAQLWRTATGIDALLAGRTSNPTALFLGAPD